MVANYSMLPLVSEFGIEGIVLVIHTPEKEDRIWYHFLRTDTTTDFWNKYYPLNISPERPFTTVPKMTKKYEMGFLYTFAKTLKWCLESKDWPI